MTEPFVCIHNLTFQYAGKNVLDGLSLVLNKGEHLLLGGESGSGKTTLAKVIAEVDHKEQSIKIDFDSNSLLPAKALYIPNWHQFTNLEGDRNFYYQQRYNKHQGQDSMTVQAELEQYALLEGLELNTIVDRIREFGFENTSQTQLHELSSGEHKKLQLIKGLWSTPQLLLIDEPYVGLDAQSRLTLDNWLDDLASIGVQLILISNDLQYPKSINRFAQISNGKIQWTDDTTVFLKSPLRKRKKLPDFLSVIPETSFETVAKLVDVSVKYGDKEVLKNISWEVKVGQKWLLQGPNGSGKSTLLSLLNGDHPQSYGLNIHLFDKKRGSGESIWEIKEKIGVVSPEMHWYFDKNATVWHTVASGFYDSIGWFIEVKFQERKKIDELLEFFGLTELKNNLLSTLPLGKQRLALLARTIVKNPPVLVLDEPCQGLDTEQTNYFNDVVDELVLHGKTLIYVGHYESLLPSCIEHRIVLEKGEVKVLEDILENIE